MISKPRAILLSGLLALAAGVSEAQSWLETRIEIEELSESGELPAAIELGDTLLKLTVETFGDSSPELAETHLFLAGAYRGGAEHAAAERQTLAAMDVYERTLGTRSTRLIEPFVLLGDIYVDDGDYELALSSYREARDIGRRAYGLLNDDQIRILDRMSTAAQLMGEYDEAEELQIDALVIIERAYGGDSQEFVDAQFHYADWLNSRRRYVDAERTYFDLARTINREFDEDPALTIRLLRAQANNQQECYLDRLAGQSEREISGFDRWSQDDGACGTAAGARMSGTEPIALSKALKIARRELEEPDAILEAAILRDIGDWYLVYGKRDRIASPYRESWNMLASTEGGAQLQRRWYARQTLLYAEPLRSRFVVADDGAPEGRIDLEFSIGIFGRPSDIRITDAAPVGLIDDAAIWQISNARFRPRIVDGNLVETTGQLSWRYRYDFERALRTGAIPGEEQ